MYSTRLHIWTKLSDDWLKTATCISENVTISFKHEYRRPTLTSRCDVISDLINTKNTFCGIFSDDLSIFNVKMNLSKIFQKFQNGHHFEVRASFNTGSCNGICIIQDRPCYSLHFELVIDTVAQILTKLLQFQKLTYFLTPWHTYLTFDLETLQTSVLSQDTSVGDKWRRYVKAFVIYAWKCANFI